MRMVDARIAVVVVLLLVCRYSFAQDGCTPTPPSTLISTAIGTNNKGVPFVAASENILRPNVGGRYADAWSMFSATQVQQHGLWCQVNPISTSAGISSNIGDWYYPTESGANGFTVVPTSDPSNSVPYQSLKCDYQIGLVVDGNVTNNQGIVKCNTTVPNLNFDANYWVVYSDAVFNSYAGPIVEPTMKLIIHSPRDANPNVMLSFSFTVSFGPLSRIQCSNGLVQVFSVKGLSSDVVYDVIRSHYINSSLPDMTRVTVRLPPQPREGRTFTCTVTVEGRVNIASGTYGPVTKGTSRSSTTTITVAGTPTGVTVSRTALTSARISWTAPSLEPAGYEVFHQEESGNRITVSRGNTSSTELILTGLRLGETYSIFVVAFGAEGAPVLPSAHSNTAIITFSIPQLTSPILTLATSAIIVTWTAPQYTADSYIVSKYCQLLCDKKILSESEKEIDETNYTIFLVDPGRYCTMSLVALFGSNSSKVVTSSINTTSAAPTGAPEVLNATFVESKSLSLVWGKVSCVSQRGPITGYRLRYSNGTSIVNTMGEGNRQHLLTGLTPFTSYLFEVAAVNDGGTGPYSDPAFTVKTLQDTPGPVTSLSTTSELLQLIISWSAPSKPNGVIVIYEVGFNNSEGVFVYTNTSATQHTLRNLPPNTHVTFSIRAYTVVGPGENVTNQASTKMIPFVAGVKVEILNSTAVRVFWTPVNLPVVDHYTVHFAAVSGIWRECDRGRFNVTAGSSSGVVSGLMTGEQYQFSVSVTVSGDGQYYTGPVSGPTDPVTVPAASSSGTVTVLVIGWLLFVISLVGNIIAISVIVILLMKIRETKLTTRLNSLVSNRTSVVSGIYDVPIFPDNKCNEVKTTQFDDVYPSKQLQRNEFEMTSCEAYSTAMNPR